jgi:hypothetical protein
MATANPVRVVAAISPTFIEAHPPHPSLQRKRSELHVGRIVDLLRKGEYIEGDLCPAPIHVDIDGYCIDGQHRLEAIRRFLLEDGRTHVAVPVIFNSNSNLVERDHAVKSRSVVDRAVLIGHPEYTSYAHSVTMYAFSTTRRIRSLDVQFWLRRFKMMGGHYARFLATLQRREPGWLRHDDPGVRIVFGVCMRAIIHSYGHESVHEFFQDFLGNSGSSPARLLNRVRHDYDTSIAGSDVYRAAFSQVAQRALVDFFAGSRRRNGYRLPIERTSNGKREVLRSENDMITIPLVGDEGDHAETQVEDFGLAA